MKTFNAERLLAYTRLLKKRDLSDPLPEGTALDLRDQLALVRGLPLRARRGNHLTCVGAPDRMRTTWKRSAQCWVSTHGGAVDGWHSARPAHAVPLRFVAAR